MIQLAIATDAPVVKTPHSQVAGLIVAGVLVLFAAAQLFTYEDFANEFMAFGMSASLAAFVAAIVPIAEVFALPFLLRMRLSLAMRIVSMALGWLVAVFWVGMAVYAVTQGLEFVPLLGATVPLIVGWWAPMTLLALVVLVVWASWGQWPLTRSADASHVTAVKKK